MEHFARMLYAALVFRALFSYKYLFVNRQSTCILSFTFLCRLFLTASSV